MSSDNFCIDEEAAFFPAEVLVVRPTFDGEFVAEGAYLLSVRGVGRAADVKAPRAGHLYMKVAAGQAVGPGHHLFSILPEPASAARPAQTARIAASATTARGGPVAFLANPRSTIVLAAAATILFALIHYRFG